jgi:hypothetical protein
MLQAMLESILRTRSSHLDEGGEAEPTAPVASPRLRSRPEASEPPTPSTPTAPPDSS